MSSPAAGGVRPASLLAPFKNATYRRLWTATLLSNFGVWIQSVAAAWLMTSIAPTVDFVAWVQAATALPPLCFTVLGGVLADRFDQRLVFLVAQVIVLSVAVLLSALDHFGLITPWLLLGLTFALDSGSSLRYPAYQTTIGDLLPREQLANALVLASIGWNIARALGPGIGGLIIAVAGVPAAFAANALCNVYIIGVLLSWYWKSPLAKPKPEQGLLSELIAGFAHVHATATIRAVMLRCFVFTGFSSALWSLLPLVAKRMAGGASTYGLLLGALGAGALLGAGMIGWMRHNWGLRRLFAAATFAVALTVLALAAVPSIYSCCRCWPWAGSAGWWRSRPSMSWSSSRRRRISAAAPSPSIISRSSAGWRWGAGPGAMWPRRPGSIGASMPPEPGCWRASSSTGQGLPAGLSPTGCEASRHADRSNDLGLTSVGATADNESIVGAAPASHILRSDGPA